MKQKSKQDSLSYKDDASIKLTTVQCIKTISFGDEILYKLQVRISSVEITITSASSECCVCSFMNTQ